MQAKMKENPDWSKNKVQDCLKMAKRKSRKNETNKTTKC